MTPSNKDAKKTSKKILETNIAFKIKEALKDIDYGESKKVAQAIQEVSEKLAKKVVKASKGDKEIKPQNAAKAPKPTPPKLSKTRATKVVQRVKRVAAKVETASPAFPEKPKVTSTAIPPVKQLKAAAKIGTSKPSAAPKRTSRKKNDADEELGHS